MPNAHTTQESCATELTRFQLEILYVIADSDDQADYGLGIKESLKDYYGESINHGRLYSNLTELGEAGYLDISALDKRTNEYSLTSQGREVLRRDAQRRAGIASNALKTRGLNPEAMPESATTGGGA